MIGMKRNQMMKSDATHAPAFHPLPSRGEMYRAVSTRDPEFDGVFYTGVKTTGIFCRPTCPAKKPRLENVEFFASVRDALCAGYRACLRCTPLSVGGPRPEWLARVQAEVERVKAERLHDADLRRLGVDPSTARRYFLKHHGMTFHAYHRARRLGLALRAIRRGGRTTEVQMSAGYQSKSGFEEAFVKIFGEAPKNPVSAACLHARWLDTPLGGMLAIASETGLCLLEFVDRRALQTELEDMRRRTKAFIAPGNNEHLEATAREMEEYFAGKRTSFSLTLEPSGSEFQRKVWSRLCEIPYGAVRSYAQLAKDAGNAKASRAVGLANGSNCLAIVIPCHRVIRSDGTLCGYGGGVHRKQWLLDHERGHSGLSKEDGLLFKGA